MNETFMKVFRIPFSIPVMDDEGQIFKEVPMPEYKTDGAAAFDLYSANIAAEVINPNDYKLIPLGIKVELKPGYKLTLKPRSGLAKNNGITVLNSPGTIDADYRGEVGVLVQNTSNNAYVLEPLTRICQGEIEPAPQYAFEEVSSESDLSSTKRGEGGFNSTGTK